MPNKEIGQNLDFKILEWWVSWYREDRDHLFCAIVEVNGELNYIERPLEET